MKTEAVNWPQVADSLEALRQELARLSDRVAVLEKVSGSGDSAVAPALARTAAPAPAAEGLSEELVVVIGAAIAAFLGKKAAIRQIRLLGTAAWGQQGRVTIQASHTLEVHTGRR
jgi:methylmalonyl-CoA carboxyltransferase 12S subunit